MKDQKIEVPPLPAELRDVEPEARAYAYAAVEADRQRRGEPVAWQPIETAPRGGQQILLTNGETVAQGWWEHEEPYIREKRDIGGHYIGQDESDGFDGWLDCEGGMQPDPTHWMPLPHAPQPAEPVKVSSDAIEELARRMCLKYSHSSDPSMRQYTFGMLTLHCFARALLARYGVAQPAASAEPVASMLVDHVNALHPYRAIPMVNVNLPDGVHMLYTAPVAAQPSTDEDAYVIDRMSKLLAEIAVIVRGPELPRHRHGYADLPERVAALKAASVAAQPDHSEQDLNMVAQTTGYEEFGKEAK